MGIIEGLADILGYILTGALILLGVIAAARVAVKTSRGERVDVPAVGVAKDLPTSVTGINKHTEDDLFIANQQNKRDGE